MTGGEMTRRARRAVLIAGLFLCGFCIASVSVWKFGFTRFNQDAEALECGPGRSMAIAIFYSDEADELEQRLATGLRAAQKCPQSLVFLLGGARPFRNYFGSEEMRRNLQLLGVSADRLRSERRSYDTRSNVDELADLVSSNGTRRITLISDPFHLMRIGYEIGRRIPGFDLDALATGERMPWPRVVKRGAHEVLGWIGALTPDSVRESIFAVIGRHT
jgi:uncharacterized SAM-binding protein YcdF (DUF218 family)